MLYQILEGKKNEITLSYDETQPIFIDLDHDEETQKLSIGFDHDIKASLPKLNISLPDIDNILKKEISKEEEAGLGLSEASSIAGLVSAAFGVASFIAGRIEAHQTRKWQKEVIRLLTDLSNKLDRVINLLESLPDVISDIISQAIAEEKRLILKNIIEVYNDSYEVMLRERGSSESRDLLLKIQEIGVYFREFRTASMPIMAIVFFTERDLLYLSQSASSTAVNRFKRYLDYFTESYSSFKKSAETSFDSVREFRKNLNNHIKSRPQKGYNIIRAEKFTDDRQWDTYTLTIEFKAFIYHNPDGTIRTHKKDIRAEITNVNYHAVRTGICDAGKLYRVGTVLVKNNNCYSFFGSQCTQVFVRSYEAYINKTVNPYNRKLNEIKTNLEKKEEEYQIAFNGANAASRLLKFAEMWHNDPSMD